MRMLVAIWFALWCCWLRSAHPSTVFRDAYTAHYLAGTDQTAFPLPASIRSTNSTNSIFCASVRALPIVCVEGDSSLVLLPGLQPGLITIDVIRYEHTQSVGEPIQTGKYSLPYFSRAVLYFPLDVTVEVDIVSPAFGALVTGPLSLQLSSSTAYDRYWFQVVGLVDSVFQASTSRIYSADATDVEPGSWFLQVTPFTEVARPESGGDSDRGKADSSRIYGLPGYGYMEYVLSDQSILQSQRFMKVPDNMTSSEAGIAWLGEGKPSRDSTDSAAGAGASTDASGQVRKVVCVWSSQVLDGQRRVWLSQAQHLDPARFYFAWIVDAHSGAAEGQAAGRGAGGLLAELRAINATTGNIAVVFSPSQQLTEEDLRQDPGDGRATASELWGGNTSFLYLYAHQSLVAANYSVNDVQPQWCRQFYSRVVATIEQQRCDVTVFGNDRHFSSNVLIVDASRLLGVPSVAELANFQVHPLTTPDVIVAPSHFSAERAVGHAAVGKGGRLAEGKTVIIPPAVDIEHFNLARVSSSGQHIYQHPACSDLGTETNHLKPCVVIGFVARLSPEKSPGLFLQTAYELLQRQPFARFTVVGDGVLRASLEGLTARLGISWAVHFTGWVGAEQLPAVLAGMDIVVNPGLVLETFCIANVEAMSMEVPLVTFAVGGVGEYVAPPDPGADQDGAVEGQRLFSVTANAVVVHRASPAALAGAVDHLILHPPLRRDLGQAARRTVVERFDLKRMVDSYTLLYQTVRLRMK